MESGAALRSRCVRFRTGALCASIRWSSQSRGVWLERFVKRMRVAEIGVGGAIIRRSLRESDVFFSLWKYRNDCCYGVVAAQCRPGTADSWGTSRIGNAARKPANREPRRGVITRSAVSSSIRNRDEARGGRSRTILRPAGILFAAGIKWLAYLRDAFLEQPVSVVQRKEFHAGSLRGGSILIMRRRFVRNSIAEEIYRMPPTKPGCGPTD